MAFDYGSMIRQLMAQQQQRQQQPQQPRPIQPRGGMSGIMQQIMARRQAQQQPRQQNTQPQGSVWTGPTPRMPGPIRDPRRPQPMPRRGRGRRGRGRGRVGIPRMPRRGGFGGIGRRLPGLIKQAAPTLRAINTRKPRGVR